MRSLGDSVRIVGYTEVSRTHSVTSGLPVIHQLLQEGVLLVVHWRERQLIIPADCCVPKTRM
jgi:hypothetical protein